MHSTYNAHAVKKLPQNRTICMWKRITTEDHKFTHHDFRGTIRILLLRTA